MSSVASRPKSGAGSASSRPSSNRSRAAGQSQQQQTAQGQSAQQQLQQQQRQVVGQYMLGKTIGEGTFGKVKLAVHMPTGEKVNTFISCSTL